MTSELNGEDRKQDSLREEDSKKSAEVSESLNSPSEKDALEAIISQEASCETPEPEDMEEVTEMMIDQLLENQVSNIDFSSLGKEELVEKLATLIDHPADKIKDQIENIKLNFYKKHKMEIEKKRKAYTDAGGVAEDFRYEEDPLEVTLKSLLKSYRERRNLLNEKSEVEKQQNLTVKLKIIEELKDLTNRQESFNETFQEFRDLQNRWRNTGPVPQARVTDLWETYHHHVEVFYNYIKINKELRDLDLKKNYETKIHLCEEAENLVNEKSIVKAFKLLQKLHEEWRETGPVAAEFKTEIWERFRLATTTLNKKHQDYFEEQKEAQKKNFELKTALCEKAESLCKLLPTTVSDWEKHSQEFIELQKNWKAVGFAPKKDNAKIYTRFRNACDTFFLKKREYFSHSKDEQNKNLLIKQELCAQAEALMNSDLWKETTETLIQLQKQWKEVGPVPRKASDVVWKRFRSACDHFFAKKSEHFNEAGNEFAHNLELKRTLIKEITAFVPSESFEQNHESLKEFQRKWSAIGFVPIKHKESIQKQYRDAINAQFDALRKTGGKRDVSFHKQKSGNAPSSPRMDSKKSISERDKWFTKLKHLESEITILENNIGFFSKSKKAESLISEVERKINNHRDEIMQIEDRIRKIDELDEA